MRTQALRHAFAKIAERHPESDLAPVARFLVGETFYRAEEYEKAVPQFESFVALYPSHLIADLGQYRLARSYFDQMPTLERELGPGVAATLARTAEQLQEDVAALDAIAEQAHADARREDGLDVAVLVSLPAAVRRRVLRLAALEERAMHFAPYSGAPGAQRMPDELAQDLVHTLNETRSQRAALDGMRQEQATTLAQFATDIERYRELKPNS